MKAAGAVDNAPNRPTTAAGRPTVNSAVVPGYIASSCAHTSSPCVVYVIGTSFNLDALCFV